MKCKEIVCSKREISSLDYCFSYVHIVGLHRTYGKQLQSKLQAYARHPNLIDLLEQHEPDDTADDHHVGSFS